MLFLNVVDQIILYLFVGLVNFFLFGHLPYVLKSQILLPHLMEEVAVRVSARDLFDKGPAVTSSSIVSNTLETLVLIVLHGLCRVQSTAIAKAASNSLL